VEDATRNRHFLGLRTVIYAAPDLALAKTWYASVLGFEPYFDQPFYVGFNVGGYELGLDPDAASSAEPTEGAVAYWGVASAADAFAHLLSLGARERSAPLEVGEGIQVATVFDPFGNVFGIIENPHFQLA
jgi:catechol 2,3-dioxygenase-like lactoylglutathione lyase family enzyme